MRPIPSRLGFPDAQTSSFFALNGPPVGSTPGFGPGRVIETWYRTGVPAASIRET